MTMARVTVTLPADLRQAVQQAAEGADVSFSSIVSDALDAWMRGRLVDEWLAEHQESHGAFEEDELRALAQEAGVPYTPPTRGRSAA